MCMYLAQYTPMQKSKKLLHNKIFSFRRKKTLSICLCVLVVQQMQSMTISTRMYLVPTSLFFHRNNVVLRKHLIFVILFRPNHFRVNLANSVDIIFAMNWTMNWNDGNVGIWLNTLKKKSQIWQKNTAFHRYFMKTKRHLAAFFCFMFTLPMHCSFKSFFCTNFQVPLRNVPTQHIWKGISCKVPLFSLEYFTRIYFLTVFYQRFCKGDWEHLKKLPSFFRAMENSGWCSVKCPVLYMNIWLQKSCYN